MKSGGYAMPESGSPCSFAPRVVRATQPASAAKIVECQSPLSERGSIVGVLPWGSGLSAAWSSRPMSPCSARHRPGLSRNARLGFFSPTPGSKFRTLVLRWNGTAWIVQPSPNVGTGNNLVSAVAAISPSSAWAVGYHTTSVNRTLVLHCC